VELEHLKTKTRLLDEKFAILSAHIISQLLLSEEKLIQKSIVYYITAKPDQNGGRPHPTHTHPEEAERGRNRRPHATWFLTTHGKHQVDLGKNSTAKSGRRLHISPGLPHFPFLAHIATLPHLLKVMFSV
jgi:hypothetical protein